MLRNYFCVLNHPQQTSTRRKVSILMPNKYATVNIEYTICDKKNNVKITIAATTFI